MKLTNKELVNIVGGVNVTGTLINSISRGITAVLDLGRSLGSSIRRIATGSLC